MAKPNSPELPAWMERYSRFLDASIGIPGTSWKVGADSIVGLVPVVGDVAGVALSSVCVVQAVRLGARRRTLFRMLMNLGLEASVGSIPLIGDVWDAWFKANLRNLRLLERDLATQPTSESLTDAMQQDAPQIEASGG